MSKDWIDKQIENLRTGNDPVRAAWGERLLKARQQGKLKGMVVKTKIDTDLDGTQYARAPEFEIKDYASIGGGSTDTW